MTPPAQLPLFKARDVSPARRDPPSPPPRSAIFPAPANAPPSREALLRELVSDWWATLDPRNWKGDGPSDAETLARYAVTGTDADDWPVVSGSRMYTVIWPTLKRSLDTPPDAVLEAVHTAIRLHGRDALRTAHEMATWHLEAFARHGTWHPQAADALATLERLSRFLGRPAPTLPELASHVLPRLRLQLKARRLHTQAEQLLALSRRDDPPTRGQRRAQQAAETARPRLAALQAALDRTQALLEDPTRLLPPPGPESPPTD